MLQGADPQQPTKVSCWIDDFSMKQNILYSPLFINFWHMFQTKVIQEKPLFSKPIKNFQRLEQSSFQKNCFPKKTSMTNIFLGYRLQSLSETFEKEREKKINISLSPLSQQLNPLDVLAYMGLGRLINLSEFSFSERSSLFFQENNSFTPVQSLVLDYDSSLGESPMKTIHLIEYNNPDDFIINLRTSDSEDEMIFAKIPPLRTFRKTVEYVFSRFKKNHQKMYFMPGDQLALPQTSFQITSSIPSMEKNPLKNKSKENWFLSKVIQQYKIGWELLSRTKSNSSSSKPFLTKNIHIEHYKMNSDRKFIFDKPFLCILRKKNTEKPYAILWIYDTRFFYKAN